MRKTMIAFAVASLACAAPALAAGPAAGAHVGVGVNAGLNAGVRGPGVNANAVENSNGRFAADRDFGRDRAEDRMSEQGRAHERASTAPQKKRSLHRPETPRAGAAASGGASTEAGSAR